MQRERHHPPIAAPWHSLIGHFCADLREKLIARLVEGTWCADRWDTVLLGPLVRQLSRSSDHRLEVVEPGSGSDPQHIMSGKSKGHCSYGCRLLLSAAVNAMSAR